MTPAFTYEKNLKCRCFIQGLISKDLKIEELIAIVNRHEVDSINLSLDKDNIALEIAFLIPKRLAKHKYYSYCQNKAGKLQELILKEKR